MAGVGGTLDPSRVTASQARNSPLRGEKGNIEPSRPRRNYVEFSRDPDLELIKACQRPESDDFEPAFEALYHKYRDRVYSIAYRITGRAVDAMDVVQDCFSLLFRRIETFRFDALFSTWLFRIVVNCSIDQVRRQRSWTGEHMGSNLSSLEDVRAEPIDQNSGPAQRAEAGELGTYVQTSIQRMSPKLRAILVLRYLEAMTYEELASTLSLSMGTVKSRLARAHIAMERVLRGRLDSLGFRPGSSTSGAGPGSERDSGSAREAGEGVA